MLRITIDNEEVVSNKNFTIEEEMLNTSSVILNNVYPKSWENDKDYTSRFYHPNDYSKCIIADQTYVEGTEGETASGTSLEINYDSSEDFEITIKGNTVQNGTPTYDSPVPVESATGDKTINVNGTDYTISLGNIELRKVGNSKDRIYKNNGKWYLERNVQTYTLNGSETWSYGTYQQGNRIYFNAPLPNGKALRGSILATHFEGVYNASAINTCSIYNGTILIVLDETAFPTVDYFKNWLSENNVDTYYEIGTPTTRKITDIQLINQLNAIQLEEGTNTIESTSQDLPLDLEIKYNFISPYWETNTLYFCGVVKNSGDISLNPREPHYQTLQILDFKTFLSEGETLDFVIANKTIEEAIEQIISIIEPYGFVKGNIQIQGSDTVIGAYSTKDKTAYDVFSYFADITQSRWTTRLIDEETVAIDFYDPTLLPQGEPIEYTKAWFEEHLIDDMSYNYGSNDYRNKQVMTSSEVYGSILQTQTIVANGYQTQFDTEQKIGQITSITANGNELSIATTEQRDLGYSADIYYTPGNTFFESADLRSAGEILIVNYIAIVEGRQIITNNYEIERVANATGRKGVVSRYENRNDATTSTELQLVGQSYIKYKGTPEIKLSVVSRENIWNIGDRVQFNAPIDELDTEYMVKKKTINRRHANPSSEDYIVYTYEMTSSFNSEQAINYFDNQRAKAKGNIGQGEYITRNVDIESTANIIFYDSEIIDVQIVGDNILNSVLNSPFNN